MNILNNYEDRIFKLYMMTHPDANADKVKSLISDLTKTRLKNIPCSMKNNVTHENLNTTMLDVFDWFETRQPIVAGNGTFFKQHEEYTGPCVVMLEALMKRRDVIKKRMYSFDPATPQYANCKTGQLGVKKIMNSDYGGCATVLSPFYSPYIPSATTGTAKNLTTTLICCLELASHNTDKWAKLNSINDVMDMIYSVVEDTEERPLLVEDTCSVEEVLGSLVSITNNLSVTDINCLKAVLIALGPSMCSRILRCYNIHYVLQHYLGDKVEYIMDYLKAHKVDVNNMTKDSIYESGYGGKGAPDAIKDDIEYVSKFIVDNCIYSYIPNDVEVRAENMERVIVGVTDTDSLMLHFANYIQDFHAETDNFIDSCILASALGMRIFIEHVMVQMIKFYALQCNVKDKYYRDKLIFKNEYAFWAMTLLAKKMYSAANFVQEGNPRDPHKIAITGLSFTKRDAAEFLEPIMKNIYDKYILTTNHIDVGAIFDEYYRLRDELKGLVSTHSEYHKKLSIKDIGAYDNSKRLPIQMRGAIVWNNIFPDEEMLPMDRVIVLQLSYELLEKYSDDPKVAKILQISNIDDPTHKSTPAICLPEHYHSIPDWIQPLIDVEFTLDKILSPFKQLFALFNVNMPVTRGGIVPSRMICL